MIPDYIKRQPFTISWWLDRLAESMRVAYTANSIKDQHKYHHLSVWIMRRIEDKYWTADVLRRQIGYPAPPKKEHFEWAKRKIEEKFDNESTGKRN